MRKKRPACSEGPHFEDEMFVLQRSRPARVATGFLQFSIMLLLKWILHQRATARASMQVIDFVVELMVEAFSRSATDFEIWNPLC